MVILVALVNDAPVSGLEAPLPLLRRELPEVTSGWVFDETRDSLDDVVSVGLVDGLKVFFGAPGEFDGPASQRYTSA